MGKPGQPGGDSGWLAWEGRLGGGEGPLPGEAGVEGVAGPAGASAYLAAEPEAWEAQGPSVWSLLTASLNRKYPGFGCLLFG